MPLFPLLLALFLLLAGPVATPASAQVFESIDHAAEYRACMELARKEPEAAFESALAWESRGGGAPAKHCSAVALMAHGQYGDAGRRFEELADSLSAEEVRFRADVLAQAGQAWVLADDLERANAAQTAAIDAQPGDAELWIDRAVTRALAQNYWEAIDDLNQADGLAPKRAEILIFRASAYRYVDALDLAREDVESGLALEPDNVEGLLERGIIRRLQGDPAGARQDWVRVATLAPGTPAADSAQANLEALDVKAE